MKMAATMIVKMAVAMMMTITQSKGSFNGRTG